MYNVKHYKESFSNENVILIKNMFIYTFYKYGAKLHNIVVLVLNLRCFLILTRNPFEITITVEHETKRDFLVINSRNAQTQKKCFKNVLTLYT